MKNIIYPTLIAIAALTAVCCSVKEDWEDCIDPRPVPDSIYVYLAFECIEIYDAGDREIVFDKVTDELELLFYNPDGKLAYNLRYTAAQLEESDWKVRLYKELVEDGDYTLLALVNYANLYYTLTGKEKLETLLAGLDHPNPEINFPLTDTYYGRYDLELEYNPVVKEHTVMLSKNTNLFNVQILFRDHDLYNSVVSVKSRITGNNTLYDWQNRAIDAPQAYYIPYRSSYSDSEKSFSDLNKTMRVWHGSDLKLEIDVNTGEGIYSITQEIPGWLAEIEKYDTDEKLEHYDEFEIKITIGNELVILAVQVNGWYVVNNGSDL